MSLAGAHVLVTGAGGFVGSHLVERLVEVGATTRALVRYNSNGSWGWLEQSPVKDEVEVVPGDVLDPDTVARAVQGVEVVFHLAALIAIPYSYQAPLSYLRTNVEGTLNVLRACRDGGVRRVVHTSTSEVYGSPEVLPVSEGSPLKGQSPYAASKIAADKMAEAFHCSYGLPVSTIRPFNTYGPRQSARAIVPTVVTQALTAGRLSLGGLEPTRDFTYVSDIVEGFIRVANVPGSVGRVINVGSGRETSIQELARIVLELSGRDLPIVRDDDRVRPDRSEVWRLCADTAAAQQILGWRPQLSLEEGLRRTIKWIEQNLDRYRPGAYAV